MTTDDLLPPHELRGLIAGETPDDHPRVSPGLATAAAAPTPLAPTLPAEDPGALALAIARVVGESFGGASVIPLHSFEMPSPGISPQLVAELPAPLANELPDLA